MFIYLYTNNNYYIFFPKGYAMVLCSYSNPVDNNSEHERTCPKYFPNMSNIKIRQGNIALVRGRQVLMT